MAQLDTVGSALRRARQRNGIALDEVAKAIKVGVHLLEALESDQFDRLPGGPFNKGFVRAYARHVGLDPEATVLAYAREERAQGLSSPDADRERRWDLSHLAMFRVEEDRKTLVLDWLALRAVLVGLLAVGILTLGGWILFRVGWAEQPVLGAARPGTPTGSQAADGIAGAPPRLDTQVAVPESRPATGAARDMTAEPDGSPRGAADAPGGASSARRSSAPALSAVSGSAIQISTPASAPAGQSRLLVAESGVGTAVIRRVLVGSGDRFEAGTRLVFWTRSLHGRPGDILRHVWSHDGRPIGSYDLRVGGPHWRNFSRHTTGTNSTGAWAVEARDAGGQVLARRTFICVTRDQM